ncbi:ecto-ADP-ribosyltransferase 5-like [Clinocottus analis]|uniref:ecto-ADP-ribosyltransferase 5-like n=1 Tax=Clinocottus analis TaxID=304258 RepID=UPI0035C0AB8E
MAMKVLWAAALLAYGASTGAAMDPAHGASSSSSLHTLDMAPNSVDDMYRGCDEQMAERVKEEFLPNEMNIHAHFKQAWDGAVQLYDSNHRTRTHSDPDAPGLTREHVLAIYAYTSASGDIYKPFNEAVKTQGPQYSTTFRFHALHYYLTKAVQKLIVRKPLLGSRSCPTVYRRTNVTLSVDVVVNTQVRFGFFASSSKFTLQQTAHKAHLFGAKTCFEIETCMGGRVLEYAKFMEAEILIPPYEAFKVKGVKKKSEQKDLPCDVVYTLKSTGQPVSNLNCALFRNEHQVQ